MKITIRTRALKTGSRSIYLDFYEKGGKVERVPKFIPRAGRCTRRKAAQ